MNREQLNKLKEPFDVSIKPGRGQYKFVKTADILDRMNETFNGLWCTDIIKVEKVGEEVLAQVLISVVNEEGKSLVWQSGFGSAKIFNGVEIGNLYKSAVSKAQKSALRP